MDHSSNNGTNKTENENITPNNKVKNSKSSSKIRKYSNNGNKTVIASSQILDFKNNYQKANLKLTNKERYSKKKNEYHNIYKSMCVNSNPLTNTNISTNTNTNTYTNTKIKNNNVKTVEIDLATFDIDNELHSKHNTNFNLNSENNSIIINNIDNNVIYDDIIEQNKIQKNIDEIIKNKWNNKNKREDEIHISLIGRSKKNYKDIYMENIITNANNIGNENKNYYLISQNKNEINYEVIQSNMELKFELMKLVTKNPKNSTYLSPAIIINEEQFENLYIDIQSKQNKLKIFNNSVLYEKKQFDEMIFGEKKIKKKSFDDELLIENQLDSLVNIISSINNNKLKNKNILFNEAQFVTKLNIFGIPKIKWNDLNKNQNEINFGIINNNEFGNKNKKKIFEDELLIQNQYDSSIYITSASNKNSNNKNMLYNEAEIVSILSILGKPKIIWNDLIKNQNEINFGIINIIKKKPFPKDELILKPEIVSILKILGDSKIKENNNIINKPNYEIQNVRIELLSKNKKNNENEIDDIIELNSNKKKDYLNFLNSPEFEINTENVTHNINNIQKNDFGQCTPPSLLLDKYLVFAVSKNIKYTRPVTLYNFSFLGNYMKRILFDENYMKITGFSLWIERIDKGESLVNSTQRIDEPKERNFNYTNSVIDYSCSMKQNDMQQNLGNNNDNWTF